MIWALICCASFNSSAQTFISKAAVEYEVKTNIRKTMGEGFWAEMMKDNMPQFNVGYFTLTFADNKSVFKFDHWEPNQKVPKWMTESQEKEKWYADLNTGRMSMEKDAGGTVFTIADSLRNLKWTLTNERRNIAGFDCRKAVTKIFDSVYIFAFYSDELMISSGPLNIGGLPGLVLGVTIPRLYTSVVATKISVTDVNIAAVKPFDAKKTYTVSAFEKIIRERSDDWFDGDDDNPVAAKAQKDRFVWNLLL